MTNIEAITAKPASSDRRAKAALRKAAARAAAPASFEHLMADLSAAREASDAAYRTFSGADADALAARAKLGDDVSAFFKAVRGAVAPPPELVFPPSADAPLRMELVVTRANGTVERKELPGASAYTPRDEDALREHCAAYGHDFETLLPKLREWEAALDAAQAAAAPEWFEAEIRSRRLENRWEAAYRKERVALGRIMDFRVQDVAQVRQKLELVVRRFAPPKALAAALRELDRGHVPVAILEEPTADYLATIISDLLTLASTPSGPNGTTRAAWADVSAKFDAACSEYRAADDAEKRIEDEAAEAIPFPPELQKPGAAAGNWMTEREIMDRHDLKAGERIELLQALQGWHEARRQAQLDRGGKEAGDRCEEAGAALDAVYEEIERLPPCDTLSLLLKHRVALGWPFTTGSLNEQMRELAKVFAGRKDAASSTTVSGATMLLDLLEMVNSEDPMLAVRRFDARAWADEFEAHPRHEVSRFGISRSEPFDGPGGLAMLDGLTDWQNILLCREGRIRDDARSIFADLRDWSTHTWGHDLEKTREAMECRHPDASAEAHSRAWAMADRAGLKFSAPDLEPEAEKAPAAMRAA